VKKSGKKNAKKSDEKIRGPGILQEYRRSATNGKDKNSSQGTESGKARRYRPEIKKSTQQPVGVTQKGWERLRRPPKLKG